MMTLYFLSYLRSVNSCVAVSCSYSAIVRKWCSFPEASCLNRRPGQGTSGTLSLSSSLACELEHTSSYAYPPINTVQQVALHRRVVRA